MSKWTLEKILACEEIKFGTMFDFESCKERRLIIRKIDNGFYSVNEDNIIAGIFLWTRDDDLKGITFYRNDMTEILPPKDKKKIKYSKIILAYSQNETYLLDSNQDAEIIINSNRHKQVVIYEHFEREIEVDCE